MRAIISLLCAACLLLALPSCLYRTPDDDEVSTNPTTNNPQINRSTNDKDIIPGIKY